jgi:hypothetical protein
MAWRAGAHPAGVAAIRQAAATVQAEKAWLELPKGAWLPQPEAETLGRQGSDALAR